MYREFHRQESKGTMYEQPRKYIQESDEAAAVSLLQYMTHEQLTEYLDDEEKLDSIIADLPQMKALKRDRENTIVKNKSLAEYNLSQQPKFDLLKREVATAYEQVNTLKVSLAEDVAKLESCGGRQSHDTTLAILQTESATTDESSEELAEKFCDGQLDIDTFISDYIRQRTRAYVQRAKVDKMTEMIRNQELVSQSSYPVSSAMSAPQTSAPMKPVTGYASSPNTAGYNSGTPYPANSYGMPNPGAYYPR